MNSRPPTSVDEIARTPVRARLSWWSRLWLLALLAICVAGVCDWLSARTQRLYIDDHADGSRQVGTVWQHFAIRGHKVVHQIITRDDARFVFPLKLRVPHKVLFSLKPKGHASYNVQWSRTGRKLTFSEHEAKAGAREFSLPAGSGDLEFTEHGSLAWVELRLVRTVFLWPLYCAAAIALAIIAIAHLRARTPGIAEGLTLTITVLLCLVGAEALLRHYRLRLPPVLIAARADLGLLGQDGRWVDPARYKLRLRGNLDTYAEWRIGDIARLGFIPNDVSRPVLHRYSIRTDAEGFRNAAVREKIDIAALGDSLTDGTTSPVEETWPFRLEQLTGKAVQNYGTSGFGPQQELYVFQDFAARRKPRWVVLGFFAGNDLHDAEAFEQWEKGKDRVGEEPAGSKLRASFRRYETFYLWTVLKVGAESIRNSVRGGPSEVNKPVPIANSDMARFDRGVFSVPVNGQLLQFAFFPPYLQKLGTPRAEIEQTRGWELTRDVLTQLKREAEANGSTLVLMFIPPKEQVYWPLVERSLPAEQIQSAIDFYCRYNHMPLRLTAVRTEQSARNTLLRDFCATEGIAMLDLTEPFQAEVAAGREVFFPDDTHWNELGHDVAARELARFLRLTP